MKHKDIKICFFILLFGNIMLYNKSIDVSILAKNNLMITAQKIKFSIKDFFSKCDQSRSSCAVDIISYRTHCSQVLHYKTRNIFPPFFFHKTLYNLDTTVWFL